MEEYGRKLSISSLKTKTGLEVFSFDTVLLGNWYIKASLTNLDTICVVMTHCQTGETNVGFFIDEEQANEFVNFWQQF